VSAARAAVVGDVMLDVVTRPLSPVAPTSDTPAATRVGRGGSGSNIAVALARRGVDVTYVGAIGRDAAAAIVEGDLRREGVTPALEEVDGPTGVVVAVVAPDGQRAMITDRGVNPRLSSPHVARVLAEPFAHLHVSGYTVLEDATREVARAALALARGRGMSTSVDVCSVAPLRLVGPGAFLDATRDALTVFANEEEALTLAGRDDVDAALAELAAAYPEVVVTRGARGAVARRGTRAWRVGAEAAEVLDTTGAGDASTGAYLASILAGDDPDAALGAAMAAAAGVVAGLGSRGQSRL
ncbi:MAG: carbohydrate kinase family protein, partial [Acidobacteriota bacterium]|nr:carbohydrate kinase family protein [Acidobacteriota bacterium]